MESFIILAPVILSFFILILPSGIRYYYSLALTVCIIGLTAIPAFNALIHPLNAPWNFVAGGSFGVITFTLDSLSAFFVLITNFAVFAGMLYSQGYLNPYRLSKSPAQLALHNFSFVWLQLSMLAVLMLRDGLAFLIAWELMAVSSFMLVLFEAEKRSTLKTAVNYLIQMHVGLVLLVIAFLLCEADTGQMNFDALQVYFSRHPNSPLFFLFFAGFAIKAGFIPFHTWLPDAHPAAPSHVSGVMSGVMIKMGIYGIVRVLTYVQSDFIIIGLALLIISSITGLLGVMMAIVQHDLKKLLAYHSIENIGIIGIGIGLGTMGLGLNNPILVSLGFAGGLLHVFNHSLFKPLLFFSAGSVYKAYHTRNIEQLGGVIHKMPQTAGLFLLGALAICGLPPLNGFISEFLIYIGLIKGLSAGNAYQSLTFLMVLISLTLIGGLAIFCFTKVFGIVFLGTNRTIPKSEISEAEKGMLIPQYLIAILIVLIGLVPIIFINPILGVINAQFHTLPGAFPVSLSPVFTQIGTLGVILILVTGTILLVRNEILKKRRVEKGPTWGCGYTASTPRQQYTGTSYTTNFGELAQPVLRQEEEFQPIQEEEIFPGMRFYAIHPTDIFRLAINRIIDICMLVLKKIARLQTGNIQHYILYAFVFILIIFVLLYLKVL
ncbi:MAG: NADH-quinone oxidoreductase subunit E [Bacteroidales bacterium]|jgi:formate hydrogenlyase subunit 3/multisubunit Na+/H+ antiporter MnhD subunit|nr:NADH-quinone oxidoreductase subunit E [Bacteroidales bacterium]